MTFKLTNYLLGKDGDYSILEELVTYNAKHETFLQALIKQEGFHTRSSMDMITNLLDGSTSGFYDFNEIDENFQQATGVKVVNGVIIHVGKEKYFMTTSTISECLSWCDDYHLDDYGIPMCKSPGVREFVQFALNVLFNDDFRSSLDIENIDDYVQRITK